MVCDGLCGEESGEGFGGQEGREEEVVVRREIPKTRVEFHGSGYGCERSKRGFSAPWPGAQTAHAGKSRATSVEMAALGVCRRGNAARKKAGFGKPTLRKTLTTKKGPPWSLSCV